jgi:hypothetical protein
LYDQNEELFLRLEQNPETLLDKVHNRGRIPLGVYFQRLWTFFLTHQTTYRMVLSGQPVYEGKKTIGEFDFVVWDPIAQVHEHWEIACKFYLSVGGTHELTHCYGPNPEDRLDRKFRHLVEHQSRLSETLSGKRLLDERGITIARTRILLKGRLFYHGAEPQYPKLSHPDHQKAWWMTAGQAKQLFAQQNYQWLILKKHQWLAPLLAPPDLLDWESFSEDLGCENENGKPIAVAMFEGGTELSRGFIVPQDWLDQLGLS